MRKPKIATIIGTRPQFIKAAVVTPVLAQFATEIMIHTGQHFDENMSDVFFQELFLTTPDHHLNIHSSSHGDMTGRMLIEVEKILQQEKPDLVLVYGDTNSTLAGALAAAKLNIPIAHVEAGVRSYNRVMPEEINRIVTDQLSSIYFVTSKLAKENLEKEGCASDHIYEVGDVMCDLALKVSQQFESELQLKDEQICSKNNLNQKNDYFLVTLHRSENTDDPKRLKALKELIEKLSNFKPVIWIMHPRTKKAFETFQIDLDLHNKNLTIPEPVRYKEMMHLVKQSFAVATDSGGLQKEAYYYKKPCITLRSETEWIELSELGWNFVIGNALQTYNSDNIDNVIETIKLFLNKDFQLLPSPPVYGEGNTAEKMGHILKQILV